MGVLRNLPKLFSIMRTLTPYNKTGKEVEAAREAGDTELEKKIAGTAATEWAGKLARLLKIDLEVHGAENFPEKDGFVIIANHQGYGDTVTLLYAMGGRQLGFLLKDDLKKIPFVGKWATRLRSVYIDRSSAKAGLKSIKEGAELVKKGFNVAIFPEGTRARGPVMGEFKTGSFRLATLAKAPIVPVSLHGSYHLYEETGVLQPTRITCVIHPPIETAGLSRKDLPELEKTVYETIKNGRIMYDQNTES